MAEFLLRKLLALAATLLSVSVIVFLALELNIEDVAINVLGPTPPPTNAPHGWWNTVTTNPLSGATWCG